ncbi:AAA family ATPase [Spirosoma flavus]
MRIHIFGASGSGVTTLGKALSAELAIPYFDADDYYWLPSSPPFEIKRDPLERNSSLLKDLNEQTSWVLGGSLDSWGEFWPSLFDLVVFLWLPTDIRVERLWQREIERYGWHQQDSIQQQRSREFIDWAAAYDSGLLKGRSLPRHEAWIRQLLCPILRLEGDLTVEERMKAVKAELERMTIRSEVKFRMPD